MSGPTASARLVAALTARPAPPLPVTPTRPRTGGSGQPRAAAPPPVPLEVAAARLRAAGWHVRPPYPGTTVPCPVCSASAGEGCEDGRGRWRRPHPARRRAAAEQS